MKKRLNILNGSSGACFSLHETHKVMCERKSCNNWLDYSLGYNCTLIASKSGPKTLQEIGKIYGLTRMRICQIEKNIYEKIKLIIQEN